MTRDEMVDYVLDRALVSIHDNERVQVIVRQLQDAHARIVAEHGLVQRRATLTTTPGDPLLALPDDFARARAFVSPAGVMREVSWQEISALGVTGGPVVYVFNGPTSITLHPTPVEAVAVDVVYDSYPEPMADGTDTPEGIPEGFHELLPETVLSRVMIAEEEPGLAAAAQQIAQDMIARMVTLVNRRGGQFSTQVPVPGLYRG